MYFASLFWKYCFLIWASRSSICFSVILMPSDVAFSSRSACWTSSVTAWPLIVWNSVVPCAGNFRGGVCCAKLRLACAISAS